MSFWDRVGEIDDVLKDGPRSVALGIAKITGNDAAAARHAANMSRATMSRVENVAMQGTSDAFRAMDVPVSYLVKRPVSTVNQVVSGQGLDDNAGSFEGSAFNPDNWRRAWNNSAKVSAGQSIGGTFGAGDLPTMSDPTKMTQQEIKTHFYDDHRGRIFSGGIDFMLYGADPLAVGPGAAIRAGQARNVVKAGDRAALFADDAVNLTRRQERQRKMVDSLLEATEGKTVSEMAGMDAFKQSTDAGTLAYWFGRANELGDKSARMSAKRDVLAAAFGDVDAIGRLRTKSASLADEVEAMSGQIQALEDARVFERALNVDGGFNFDDALGVVNDPARLKRLERQRDAIQDAIHQSRRLVGEKGAESGIAGQLTHLTPGGSWAESRHMARVSKVIQDGAGNDPIHVITGRRLPGIFKGSDAQAVDIFRDTLARAKYLPAERRADLMDRFSVATAKERSVIAIQAENEIFRHAAANFAPGMTKGQIETLIRTTRGRKASYLRQLSSRSRAFGSVDADNYVAHIDEDGVVMAIDSRLINENVVDAPMLAPQITDQISMVDPRILQSVLKRHGNSRVGLAGHLRRTGEDAWELADAGASTLNRLWKFSALFRLSYPMRVQVDTQMRLVAAMGAMEYAATTARGAGNYLKSLRHMGSGQRRALTDRIAMSKMDDAARARLAKVEERLVKNPTSKVLQDEKARLIKDAGGEVLRTRHGVYDATVYRDRDEFWRMQGLLDSEDSVYALMTDEYTKSLRQMRASGAWDRVAPDSPDWMNAYLRVVNKQFRNDPVAQMMVSGYSDDAIIRWLRTNDEGRQHWKMLKAGYPDPDTLVGRVRQNLDELLPEDSALRANATTRALNVEDVETFWRLPADRPAVRGEVFHPKGEQNAVAAKFDEVSGKWYNFASTMPENVMGRHPLYQSRFREYFAERIAQAESVDGRLSLKQIEQLRRQASQMARKDVTDTLYDVSRQSNAAHTLRFISPFFSAWEDTMHKWGRLIGGDPGIGSRLYQAWGAPNNAGLVVDEEGRRILKNGDVLDDSGKKVGHKSPLAQGQYVMLPFGWKGAGIGSLRVSKTSFNIVFQGDPWWLPGPGPMAAVPVQTLVAGTFPEFVPGAEAVNQWGPAHADNPFVKWVLPYGPEKDGAEAQFTPAWVDRLKSLWQGQESADFAATYSQLYAEEVNRNRLQGIDVPQEELARTVNQKTRNWFLMRFMAAEASPVSITPQSPLQFYLEEFRRYRREFGAEADAKFRQDYPDYYDMAISLSASNTSLNATVEAWDGIDKYRGRAAKFPEYAWAYAGAANVGGEFSDSVYAAQFQQNIGPGTSKKFRERADPAEMARKVQANQGWADYNAGMERLRLELEDRGLHSFDQKAASDLNDLRKMFIENLKNENEAFAQDFGDGGSGKVEQFFRWAEKETSRDKTLRERRDFQLLEEYKEGRARMQAALASRKYTSLDHDSNEDLKAVWDQFTGTLIASDIGFGQMYTRVLEKDDLSTMKPLEGSDG